MKTCIWCKKKRPDEEEGGIELNEDGITEKGWICDHCLLRFDGKCNCKECTDDFDAADLSLMRIKSKMLIRNKTNWGVFIGCIFFALPLWIIFVLYIWDWFF